VVGCRRADSIQPGGPAEEWVLLQAWVRPQSSDCHRRCPRSSCRLRFQETQSNQRADGMRVWIRRRTRPQLVADRAVHLQHTGDRPVRPRALPVAVHVDRQDARLQLLADSSRHWKRWRSTSSSFAGGLAARGGRKQGPAIGLSNLQGEHLAQPTPSGKDWSGGARPAGPVAIIQVAQLLGPGGQRAACQPGGSAASAG